MDNAWSTNSPLNRTEDSYYLQEGNNQDQYRSHRHTSRILDLPGILHTIYKIHKLIYLKRKRNVL